MSFRRGKRRSVDVWTKEGEYIGTFPSLSKAAERADVSISAVSYVLSGQRTSANGYVFKEANNGQS